MTNRQLLQESDFVPIKLEMHKNPTFVEFETIEESQRSKTQLKKEIERNENSARKLWATK